MCEAASGLPTVSCIEQVTKQFLTMSLGWADNVLLSMGPLGILTIVVSAIRVGGVRRLKALVGR